MEFWLYISVWCRFCMILFLNLISVVVYFSELNWKYEGGEFKIGNFIENILKVSTEIPILRYSKIATFQSLVINQICLSISVHTLNCFYWQCTEIYLQYIPVAGIHLISDCSSSGLKYLHVVGSGGVFGTFKWKYLDIFFLKNGHHINIGYLQIKNLKQLEIFSFSA